MTVWAFLLGVKTCKIESEAEEGNFKQFIGTASFTVFVAINEKPTHLQHWFKSDHNVTHN